MKLSFALPSGCKIFYLATVFVKGKITASSVASRWLLLSSSSKVKTGPFRGPQRAKFQVKIEGLKKFSWLNFFFGVFGGF